MRTIIVLLMLVFANTQAHAWFWNKTDDFEGRSTFVEIKRSTVCPKEIKSNSFSAMKPASERDICLIKKWEVNDREKEVGTSGSIFYIVVSAKGHAELVTLPIAHFIKDKENGKKMLKAKIKTAINKILIKVSLNK